MSTAKDLMSTNHGDKTQSDTSKIRKCLQINKSFIPLKAIYFFFIAGQAAFFVYHTVFMRHLGLSPQQGGMIFAAQRTAIIIMPPLIGFISDKLRRPKLVLIVLLIFGALIIGSLLFVPIEQSYIDTTSASSEINSAFVKNTTVITPMTDLPTYNTSKAATANIEYISNSSYTNVSDQTNIDEYGATFMIVMILFVLTTPAYNGGAAVIEGTVFVVLGEKNKHKFGQQRVWAALGYGISSIIAGYLRDLLRSLPRSNQTNLEYIPCFGATMLYWFISAFVASKLPVSNASREPVRLKNVKKVVANFKILSYLTLIIFFFGYSLAVMGSYGIWLAEESLGASSTIIGMASLIGAFGDIPMYFLSGSLIKKFGHAPLLIFCQIVTAMRLFFFSIITVPWQFVVIQSFRGVTWGLFWSVSCSYVMSITPKKLEATTMGIVYATSHGIGSGVGAVLGGYLFSKVGGQRMFFISFLMVLPSCVLYSIIMVINRFACCKSSTKSQNEGKDVVSEANNYDFNKNIESSLMLSTLNNLETTDCSVKEDFTKC